MTMSNPLFIQMVMPTLDQDLRHNVATGYIDVRDAMQLQMLRTLDRAFPKVLPNPPGDTSKVWTDGVAWHPKAPGT